MSSLLPFNVSVDPFEKIVRGVFGRFQTKDSYRLNYILASLPFSEIDQLLTAADAISITDPEVTFAQLIQRDIDFERVKKMSTDYLEVSKDRVVFFPPLLVSLLGLRDGHVVKKFDSAKPEIKDGVYEQTWHQDYFRLRLPTTSTSTGHVVSDGSSTVSFYNFGAVLQYNPRLVKLVVIDGQHRLQALKSLKGKSVVDTIEIPICVVFPPDAVVGSEEEVTRDLRELFVRINDEATKVSGHFITLLDDKTLSALTIRQLGDLWKSEIKPNGYTRLQLLEWNQRHSKLAFQVTRNPSITTVSIVAAALSSHLFHTDTREALHAVIGIDTVKAELEGFPDAIAVEEICDATFHPRQLPLLSELISRHLTPALDVLFRLPRPYRDHEAKVIKSYDWLNVRIQEGVKAAAAFKADVLQQFRLPFDTDPPAVQTFSDDYLAQVEKAPGDIRFFYNVFQQGLVRCWITVSAELAAHTVPSLEVAKAVVAGLDRLCFDGEAKLFSPDQPFVRRVLYNGERVLLGAAARDGWYNLTLASLGGKKCLAAFMKALEKWGLDPSKAKDVSEVVKRKAVTAAHDYLERFLRVTEDDLAKNYFERDLTKTQIDHLTRLDRSRKEEDRVAFVEEIAKIAERRRAKALEILSNVIDIDRGALTARPE